MLQAVKIGRMTAQEITAIQTIRYGNHSTQLFLIRVSNGMPALVLENQGELPFFVLSSCD